MNGTIATGRTPWIYNPATDQSYSVGLFGPEFVNSDGISESYIERTYADGHMYGSSSRYFPATGAYRDVVYWHFDPTTNLTYQIPQSGSPDFLGPFAVRSSRLQTRVGDYLLGSHTIRPLSNGPLANGFAPFVYNIRTHTTTNLSGLTGPAYVGGPDNYRDAGVQTVLPSPEGPLALGYTRRIGSASIDPRDLRGGDAWLQNLTTGVVTRISLLGPGYIDNQRGIANGSTIFTDADRGLAIVSSTRFGPPPTSAVIGNTLTLYNTLTGQSAQVGLTGPDYTGPNGESEHVVSGVSPNGVIYGYSAFRPGIFPPSAIANEAWYIDPVTLETRSICGNAPFSVRPSDGYRRSFVSDTTSIPEWLGYYRRFTQPPFTTEEFSSFVFTPGGQFLDIRDTLNPAFPQAQVVSFDSVRFDIEPRLPFARGVHPSQVGTQRTSLYAFLPAPAGCDAIDFNNDGLFPSEDDLIDFLTVFAGGQCSQRDLCNDIDFNNDALFPDDNDIVAFLRVLAGGNC